MAARAITPSRVKCRKTYQFLGGKELPSRKYPFQQAIRGWHCECGKWPLEAATGRIVKKAGDFTRYLREIPNAPLIRSRHSSRRNRGDVGRLRSPGSYGATLLQHWQSG